MKSAVIGRIYTLIFFVLFLSGCEAIEGIFKAGVWTGFVIVALVIVLIIFVLRKIF
ncbi:phosphatidate cytidylyltransferase [Sporocytophaga myxococcoides]|uniref:phosphatidate cytidylyltransferase n=1 Tax=Sporocytophaga myxococcoides TaxID=153721 RepID=UPI0012DD5693|nr:phosphatidate cytidylyltransferase [Sporocytophaga myxococcoides]